MRIERASSRDARAVRAIVENRGAAHVPQLGGIEDVLALAAQFGVVIEPGVGMAPGLHDGRVHLIRVHNEGNGLTDIYGNTIISTTSLPFSLHTDGYNLVAPPHYVLLLRLDDAEDVQPTYVSDFAATSRTLSSGQQELLGQVRFPGARGPKPLLETLDHGRRLRLNREEIERWAGNQGNQRLDPSHLQFLVELTQSLEAGRGEVTLRCGDGLVLDNWRMCHGRPRLPASSPRVIARVWVA